MPLPLHRSTKLASLRKHVKAEEFDGTIFTKIIMKKLS
jgi:hypothetical protein